MSTARQVFEAARGGDLTALDLEGRRIGIAITAITAIADPEVVVLRAASATTSTCCARPSSVSWPR